MIVPGSRIVSLLNTNMTGTWKLRGMLRGDGSTPTITVALINLTDANTTPLTNGTISSSSTVGASVTSGAISGFATGTKDYGCKIISNDAAKYGYAYGLELVSTA